MPRLTPVRRSDLPQVLRANGFTRERPATRHYSSVAHHSDASRRTTIPNYAEIEPKLLTQILKQAGKSRDEFLRILSEL